MKIIIGGGFTATLLAKQLEDDTDDLVMIYPSKEEGGLIRNTRVKGFSFDLGGHVYAPKQPLKALIEKAGGITHERKAYYAHDSGFVPYPVQSYADQLGLRVWPGDPKDSDNLEEFFTARFGKEFTQDFLIPFNKRVWQTHPSKMSCDWVATRVPPPVKGAKDWGSNAQFIYAPGDKIIEAIGCNAQKINDVVRYIDIEKKTVYTESGAVYNYDVLFDTSGMLMSDPQLPFNYVLSIGIGFKSHPDLPEFSWVYGNLSSPIHRITNLSAYHPSNVPTEESYSLLAEVPFKSFSQIKALTRVPIEKATKAIARALSVDPKVLLKAKPHVIWQDVSRGYPIPTLLRNSVVSDKKVKLLGSSVFSLGRWGSHAYYNLDHLMLEVAATVEAYRGNVNDDYIYGAFYYGKA